MNLPGSSETSSHRSGPLPGRATSTPAATRSWFCPFRQPLVRTARFSRERFRTLRVGLASYARGDWSIYGDGPSLNTTCPRWWGKALEHADVTRIEVT